MYTSALIVLACSGFLNFKLYHIVLRFCVPSVNLYGSYEPDVNLGAGQYGDKEAHPEQSSTP